MQRGEEATQLLALPCIWICVSVCVYRMCLCITQSLCCVHVSGTSADLAASAQWHFPSSGCSPDIFLVSDQSWFSQMSHSLRHTSLNAESASVFAKTQTSGKRLIFPTEQSHQQWFLCFPTFCKHRKKCLFTVFKVIWWQCRHLCSSYCHSFLMLLLQLYSLYSKANLVRLTVKISCRYIVTYIEV